MTRHSDHGAALPMALAFLMLLTSITMAFDWSTQRQYRTIDAFNDRMTCRILMAGVWQQLPAAIQPAMIRQPDADQTILQILPDIPAMRWDRVTCAPFDNPGEWLVRIEGRFAGHARETVVRQEARIALSNDSIRILDVDEL